MKIYIMGNKIPNIHYYNTHSFHGLPYSNLGENTSF